MLKASSRCRCGSTSSCNSSRLTVATRNSRFRIQDSRFTLFVAGDKANYRKSVECSADWTVACPITFAKKFNAALVFSILFPAWHIAALRLNQWTFLHIFLASLCLRLIDRWTGIIVAAKLFLHLQQWSKLGSQITI